MNFKHILIQINIIAAVTSLSFVSGGYHKKKCSISSLDESCPPNARCLETVDTDGECICHTDYIFNALYTNDQDYCYHDHTTVTPLAAISDDDDSATPHHHIIGGILIPLVLVAALIGGAYVVVRYRLLARIRQRIAGHRRRQRPTYQDVAMMGTEFDPPLI